MSGDRQTWIGLGLAAAILGAWCALHVYGVFLHEWRPVDWGRTPLLVLVQTWLSVGLFIVAHDAMHGSLAPGRGRLNRMLGRLALALYAGFSFDRMAPKHHEHHARPGTAHDPDFLDAEPQGFWRWYASFFARYFGLRELAVLSAAVVVYVAVLGARIPNLLVFWALPAIASSLQLFAFGTYLPHRRAEQGFADAHQARSLNYSRLASLLTCFHFGGRHHTHHLKPHLPWWRLPAG